jgi:hypothetical protein
VNIKIAGKWMFIPLKMVLIGIDPYPYIVMGRQCSSMFESRGFDPVNSACFNAKEPSRELGWIDILLLMSNRWSYDGLMRRMAGVQGFKGAW